MRPSPLAMAAMMAAFIASNPMSAPLMCVAGTIALIQKELLP